MKSTPFLCVLAAFFVTMAPAAAADDLDKAQKALQIIQNFADSICNKVEAKGHATTTELSGDAKLEVSKLVKQLADLHVEGAAKYTQSDYEGLLQQDVADAMKSSAQCKQQVFERLNEKLLPMPVAMYDVVVRSGKAFIDNRRFGPVDGGISSLELKIDGVSVAKADLDAPFHSHTVKLSKGDHSFEFVGDIYGAGNNAAILDDNCAGTFSVDQSGTFAPHVVIRQAYLVGEFSSCSLESN